MLHLLGHVHFTRPQDGASSAPQHTVPVSGKAAALLTYLRLEGQPHHREHLAGLLWDTPDPLRNLRVELARLKRDGVAHFPERQPMLSFHCPLDLDAWTAAAAGLPEHALLPWLATLRGLPLSGLEDLGGSQFQQWLDGQRWLINEQVERTLASVQARFLREQRARAAAQVRARAESLGLNLEVPVSPAEDRPWQTVREAQTVREEQRRLGELMARETAQPQLVLLHGRSGSGKRSLIRQSAQEHGWQAIQLQASAQRPLFQEALAQQLSHLGVPAPLPGAEPRGPHLRGRGGSADDALIELAAGLQQSGRVVIALHNAALGLPWLAEVARFLLDLPLPLILILSESSAARLSAVQSRTAFVEGHRRHSLEMSPLTTRTVLRAWQDQGDVRPGEGEAPGATSLQTLNETHARAAALIQRSEGWPLHAQALGSQRDQNSLPENVRSALLGDLVTLPRTVRAGLTRLSLIHDRFTPEVAELLLGQDAPQVLLHAVQQGVLVPSAAHEELRLSSLHHRSDDQTRSLQFASEPTRIALAGTLTGLERQDLRRTLARYFQDLDPLLSLHHARSAGLSDSGPSGSDLPDSTGPTQRAAPSGGHASPGQLQTGARPAGVPASLPPFRQEVRTPNGYRVALDSGHLEIFRRGWYGLPPLLTLQAGEVPQAAFVLTARLDVFRGAPRDLSRPAPFALGLRVGGGARMAYAPAHTPGWSEGEAAEDDGQLCGDLPIGEWFSLRGQGPAGALELSVRALDLALTVAELQWGETQLLPSPPRP